MSNWERSVVADHVRRRFEAVVTVQSETHVPGNAKADPGRWQDGSRELIASDSKRVQAIMEEVNRESHADKHGFTLIELSIVLVIIGLIVGGVLVGQSLISAAAVRAQVTQLEKISTAMNTFHVKYDALPGDFTNNAPAFGFGQGSYPGVASGDDGQIEDGDGHSVDDGVGMHEQTNEPLAFFGQLVDAHLLESRFVCPPTAPNLPWRPTQGNYAISINPQASMIAATHLGATWVYMGINLQANGCNVIYIGGNTGGVMTPAQAYDIDRKIDDGIPGTGNFYATAIISINQLQGAVDNNPGQCVVDATSQQYNLANSQSVCSIMAKLK